MQSDFSGLLALAAIAYFLPTVIALLRWLSLLKSPTGHGIDLPTKRAADAS